MSMTIEEMAELPWAEFYLQSRGDKTIYHWVEGLGYVDSAKAIPLEYFGHLYMCEILCYCPYRRCVFRMGLFSLGDDE